MIVGCFNFHRTYLKKKILCILINILYKYNFIVYILIGITLKKLKITRFIFIFINYNV